MTPAGPSPLTNALQPAPDQGLSEGLGEDLEAICRQAGEHARQLMTAGGLYCTPAVLTALNQRLDGGLSDDLLRRLTAGLPEGMGSGCTCGALSGGQLALGLFLGQLGFGGDMAKAAHGSTCCRVLTKKAKGRKARGEHCAGLAAHAAELACGQVLKARPELAEAGQDAPPLSRRSWWKRLRRG